MELKLNDVYKFRYNEEWDKKSDYWCFDGQLIVKQKSNGELYLEDTFYWDGNGSKTFTLKQALERGEITLICNLDEVELCREYDLDYYDDKDYFDLSRQHRSYIEYYKKKEAVKSLAKMEQSLESKIKSIESEIKSKEWELERAKKNLEKIKTGDIEVYF